MLKNFISFTDSLYGIIPLSYAAHNIINSNEFNRLKHLKQLGTCHLKFPTATHTRYEHSIGTYHLTDIFLDNVFQNSDNREIIDGLNKIPELTNYDKEDNNHINKIKEMVKIAGLCHDLGHGPYSHLFDDQFLKTRLHNEYSHHEFRSCNILNSIIKKNNNINSYFSDNDIKFMSDIIDPKIDINDGFIYQIVSNKVNGIDVDKFDYLTRDYYYLEILNNFNYKEIIHTPKVINNNICYPKSVFNEFRSPSSKLLK
jgi:HD superfamily phosphohydrolase